MFGLFKWFKGTSDEQSCSSLAQRVVNQLSEINHRLNVASRLMHDGPHEMAHKGERYYVMLNVTVGGRRLLIGQCVSKLYNVKGEYEFYVAEEVRRHGETFIQREEEPLDKRIIEQSIAANRILVLGDPVFNVPVRVNYKV